MSRPLTRLGRWLALIGALAVLSPVASTQQAGASATGFIWTPTVVRQNDTGPVRLEVLVSGTPSRVVFAYSPNAASPNTPASATYDLVDDGTRGDLKPGDGVYTVTLTAPMLARDLTASDVFDRLVGFIYVYAGTAVTAPYQLHLPVITDEIPRVTVTPLASDAQASPHLLNILDPGFAAGMDYGRAYRRFYDFFDDDYYGINVVTLPSRFLNRFGGALQLDATGLGATPQPVSPLTGSAGGLFHMSAFPLLPYFDGAESGVVHELGHQWVNLLRAVPALAPGSPHWPVSSLAGGVMGWSAAGGEGLEFGCTITEAPGGLRVNRRSGQGVFSDFDLYLMGLLPPSQVADAFVLPLNDTVTLLPCTGGLYTGPYQRVSIKDVIDAVGPRVPAAGQARTRFRIATVVVTEDRLLDADAMAYIDYFAARMELTGETQVHAGYVKTTGKPFAVATRGLGSIDASLAPRTGADFSMTVSPSTLTLPRGQQARFTIHVESRNGTVTTPVGFECFSTIETRPCQFDPPVAVPGSAGADVVVTMSGAGTMAGGYRFVVRGTAGSLRHTAGATLVVP